MKIKRFNESEEINISNERIGEIIDGLKDLLSTLENKSTDIDSYINEFNAYKSDSVKGNDQIDDSISALQIISKDMSDINDKIDTIVNNLLDYVDNGRKYIYTEAK